MNRPPVQNSPDFNRKPQPKPQVQQKKESDFADRYGKKIGILLIITAALLVVSIVILCIALAVDGTKKKTPTPDRTPDKDPPATTQSNTPTIFAKFLTLPSSTTAENYKSAMAGDKKTIEKISSAFAVLVDMDTNVTIAGKEEDAKVYPASMTKVMTLLVACENAQSPTDRMTVTQEMIDYQTEEGASGMMGFSAGESITVEDALFLVNYNSDTVACLLLAEYVAGSEAAFVEKMNQKAQAIGLTSTHFANSTGLDDPNHYTTCREMAAIMKAAMSNSAAQKVLTSYEGYTVNIYSGSTVTRTSTVYAGWYSTRLKDNPWAGGGSDMKFLGGKTGNETNPSSCFVTVAKDTGTGKQYICVTVGRADSTGTKVTDTQSTNDAKIIYKTYAEGRT